MLFCLVHVLFRTVIIHRCCLRQQCAFVLQWHEKFLSSHSHGVLCMIQPPFTAGYAPLCFKSALAHHITAVSNTKKISLNTLTRYPVQSNKSYNLSQSHQTSFCLQCQAHRFDIMMTNTIHV